MKFVLGKLEFCSKKLAKDYVSNYLKNNITINDEDITWIIDLLKKHPRWNEKSINFEKVIIKKSLKNHNTFHLVKTNGEIEDISYIKCFEGENEKELQNKALRYEIETQIIEFRNKVFSSLENPCCELCKRKLINDKSTHIDHLIKFKSIVESFLKLEPIIETKSIGYERIIVDEKIKKKWQEFHKNNAILRPLCANCNLTDK